MTHSTPPVHVHALPSDERENLVRLRRLGQEPATAAERAPPGVGCLEETKRAGWDPRNPNRECVGRTSSKSFDFGNNVGLTDFDKEGIRWRTCMLELNWRFGYGIPDAARIKEWRRTAALYVLEGRCRVSGAQPDAPMALALWEELEQWYTFRFRPSLRRLNRCEDVLKGLLAKGREARARQFVERWAASCEPALTAQEVLNRRPHLFLADADAVDGLGRAIAMHDDPTLLDPSASDPRQVISFLAFAGKVRPLVIDGNDGRPVVHCMRTLDALRFAFGDQRPRTLQAQTPPQLLAHADEAVADWHVHGGDLCDQLDERDRVLCAVDALDSPEGTPRADYVRCIRAFVAGELGADEFPSFAMLAERHGVDESRIRQIRDSVQKALALRLGLAS